MTRPKILYKKDIKEIVHRQDLRCSEELIDELKSNVIRDVNRACNQAKRDDYNTVMARHVTNLSEKTDALKTTEALITDLRDAYAYSHAAYHAVDDALAIIKSIQKSDMREANRTVNSNKLYGKEAENNE